MNDPKRVEYAALVLRVSLGVMFLMHSVWLKAVVFSLAGTADYFVSIGLPGLFAYVVFLAETIGGIMLILGIQTRWVAIALLPILLGATWVHSENGWLFINDGGGWEYPAFLAAATLVLILLGDGENASDSRQAKARRTKFQT
ncbi:MAG: DoxX family protein [Gammaproteobacteria bacterium]|nr:DoxX family protein [Gammaproteobacteria bacterium]